MPKKRIVMALGHKALGTNLPEQKEAAQHMSRIIADFVQDGWQVAVVHSNAPQVGMIHTAMNEFGKQHEGYTPAPMSVCSAMSQGYIGYDLQNAIRAALLGRGIYKPVSTILTQVTVDPYDEASHTPAKSIGRILTAEEAAAEEAAHRAHHSGDPLRKRVRVGRPCEQEQEQHRRHQQNDKHALEYFDHTRAPAHFTSSLGTGRRMKTLVPCP